MPDRDHKDVVNAQLDEVIYSLMKSLPVLDGTIQEKNCPTWVPFHISSSKAEPANLSTVAYNPIIMAPPTDLSTVYTTLKRSKEIANKLGHDEVPIFFDMGLLTKALEVTWANPEDLRGLLPMEGGMHFLMAVMAGIGFAYSDAGIFHLLSESGVFAAGTVQQILGGKQFSRGLYAMKLVDEVFQIQFMKNFSCWCDKNDQTFPCEVLEELHHLASAMTDNENQVPDDVLTHLRDKVSTLLLPLVDEFREEGRKTSPTFRLWDEFLRRVSTPFKMFLAASRKGDWKVHQEAKTEFLPLLFATNRNIYARYMSVMLLSMRRLPPVIQEHFEDGNFVSTLSNGSFNKVWPDYVLETTENKALKGAGGVIGLTLRGPALLRWFLARPVTAQYSTDFQAYLGHQETRSEQHHHSSSNSAVKRWNSDVEKMSKMFEDSYVDPFSLQDPPTRLVNFATGVVATSEVEESLLTALDKGESMAKRFVSERLMPSAEAAPAKSFYQTLPRSGLKTMAVMSKPVKVDKRQVQMNADLMYFRLLAINAKKNVPLKRVMSFENAPVPLSMFS